MSSAKKKNEEPGVSKSAAALRHVLQNRKASDVPSPNKVVEINVDMSPVEAAMVLWDNNILGAPTWDNANQKYVGFFDMRDILAYVVASHKEHVLEERSTAAAGGGGDNNTMDKWVGKMNVSTNYLAARNPFVACKADASLEDVCRVLVKPKCHRIPIVDDGGRCVRIISQSALVKFLVSQVPVDKKTGIDPLNETLKEANLPCLKDVVKANDTMEACNVFEMLDAHRLSGIAIVDAKDGRLVGNTSARDIKLAVLHEGKIDMHMDILSYLAAVRQATPAHMERYPSVHVSETSTVGRPIRMLAKTGYHRVFVVDQDTKPVGVISVADVIRFAVGSD